MSFKSQLSWLSSSLPHSWVCSINMDIVLPTSLDSQDDTNLEVVVPLVEDDNTNVYGESRGLHSSTWRALKLRLPL